ncbi:MAG: hypothetical protein P1P77_16965, partial [Spirochaetaceae bacterium]|nr:hypothetical protein [Spirochaetaceae bacterium]
FSGGLSLGYFGYAIKAALCRDHAEGRREFIFPRRRAILPMAGAALMVGSDRDVSDDGGIVALDFGHSSVKSGLFTRSANQLVDYIPLGQTPTPRNFSMLDGIWHAENESLRAFFFGRIHSAVQEAELRDGPLVGLGISIANYVQNGRVVPRGLYGFLKRDNADEDSDIGADIGSEIAGLARRIGLGEEDYSFMHDGTAAAVPYAGLPGRTAVIVLGSAIGGGFPTTAPKARLALEGFM